LANQPPNSTSPQPLPMIWDLHCHLSGVDGATPAQRIAQVIEIADRMEIERFVFYMGFPWSQDPAPDDFRKQNDQVIEALQHWHHRAVGFAYVNPKHEEESLKELDRCIKEGPLVGVKLWVAVRCSDQRLDAIVRRAGELQAVLYQHTWLKTGGNLAGESSPLDLAELAARHPMTQLICGHTGGDWEQGIRAVRPHKNVYIDTAGSDPTAGLVEMAVRELGADRIIYGSDCGGRSFASQLAKITSADIPEADRNKILGGNLRKLLFPIMKSKGMRL
jgi:predicted TIM-barrel fold metal-dependent hydrolase